MRRQDTDHPQSEFLRILDDFARGKNLSIADETTQAQLLEAVSAAMQESRTNPIRLHGFRIQSMFAYLAAALGNSKIISEEDTGIFFSTDETLRQPDFRIVTLDGTQFLVEVKNFHSDDATRSYKFKKPYLDSVCAYAEQMGLPLKFAIYWSRWGLWTLVDSENLDRSSNVSKLDLPTALTCNELNMLGDSMIGTKPPLTLRFHADKKQPRTMDQSGNAPFTIREVTLHSADVEIKDETERKIAFFLMFNGKWNDVQHRVKLNGSLVEFTELSVAPEETTEGQGFEIVGSMSEMISYQYLQTTSKDGIIQSLSPRGDLKDLGVIIPHNFKGESLHIWQLNIQPNFGLAAKQRK